MTALVSFEIFRRNGEVSGRDHCDIRLEYGRGMDRDLFADFDGFVRWLGEQANAEFVVRAG